MTLEKSGVSQLKYLCTIAKHNTHTPLRVREKSDTFQIFHIFSPQIRRRQRI